MESSMLLKNSGPLVVQLNSVPCKMVFFHNDDVCHVLPSESWLDWNPARFSWIVAGMIHVPIKIFNMNPSSINSIDVSPAMVYPVISIPQWLLWSQWLRRQDEGRLWCPLQGWDGWKELPKSNPGNSQNFMKSPFWAGLRLDVGLIRLDEITMRSSRKLRFIQLKID